MRCIEIYDRWSIFSRHCRLTLTWDVLKCGLLEHVWPPCFRLTLTWDVLKLKTNDNLFKAD